MKNVAGARAVEGDMTQRRKTEIIIIIIISRRSETLNTRLSGVVFKRVGVRAERSGVRISAAHATILLGSDLGQVVYSHSQL